MKGNLVNWMNLGYAKKAAKALRAVCAVALCMTAWGYAQHDLNHSRIKRVRILWQDQHGLHMLKDHDVHAFLGPLEGKQSPEIYHKELALRKLPYLSKAELCYNADHELMVFLNHREPVFRVFPERTPGYFLAKDGVGLPLKPDFAAPLPILLGNIPLSPPSNNESCNTGIMLALKAKKWLDQDSVLKSTITQYIISGIDSNALILKTINEQEIWVGTSMDLSSKLSKLSTFYSLAPSDSLPESFHSINLVFKNQIVCR